MEFKAGDRVRVLRFNGEDVDFYGTLKYVDKCMANLFDCTIKRNEGLAVFLPSDNSFGEDKEDYYILAEDEEDTKGGNNLPTIKRKVEMNLPELIEWGFRNNIENESYKTNGAEGYELYFDSYGTPRFSSFVNRYDTFTVEVDEPITENTVFELMIEITDGCPNYLWEEASVEEWKDEDSKEFHAYIDGKFKLIWTKEEGLVE